MDKISTEVENGGIITSGEDLPPFYGASLAYLMPLVFELPAVSIWLERRSDGPVLMIEAEGEREEFAHWDANLGEWGFDSPTDAPADVFDDSGVLPIAWLPDGANRLDDLTDEEFDEFVESTESIRRCLLEQLSFGWKLSCELTTGQDNGPKFTLVAEPPQDVGAEIAWRAATMVDCDFGTSKLTWNGPPPTQWGASWTLSDATINGVGVPTTQSVLDSLYLIGSTTAPGWTLPPGFDRPVVRHSENGTMPDSRISVTFDETEVTRSAEASDQCKRAVRVWADEEGFGPTLRVPSRAAGSPWTPATRRQFVRSVDESLASMGTSAGYYLLGFENGDSYVGQSSDIAKRLASHLRERPSVDSIALLPDAEAGYLESPLRHLLNRERQLIHSLQRAQHPSRNKAEMTYRTGSCSLDDTFYEVGITAQKWLADPAGCNATARTYPPRANPTPGQVSTGTEALQKLADRAGSKFEQIIAIQSAYTQRCLPIPRQTELEWWVVSSPSKTPKHRTLSNLSVGWGIECLRINVGLTGWVQVNLVELFGEVPSEEDFLRFMRQHPGTCFDNAPYKDGGAFNANLRATNLDVLVSRFVSWFSVELS